MAWCVWFLRRGIYDKRLKSIAVKMELSFRLLLVIQRSYWRKCSFSNRRHSSKHGRTPGYRRTIGLNPLWMLEEHFLATKQENYLFSLPNWTVLLKVFYKNTPINKRTDALFHERPSDLFRLS